LHDAVAERAHVVQEEVRVGLQRLVREPVLRGRLRQVRRRHVAIRATNRVEDRFADMPDFGVCGGGERNFW
jgi:hypothetical protein